MSQALKRKMSYLFISVVLLFCCGFTFEKEDAEELDNPRAFLPKHPQHTDHSTFFTGALSDGPAATRACLECHPHAAPEVMKTVHWRWEGEPVVVPGHDLPVRIGKKNLINNFCIGIQSNWPRCTSCHAGYGWADDTFDFEKAENVDCLVCHDQTGSYVKNSGDAGRPDSTVDLLAVAKSVGIPKRGNCGVCHFAGGGGDAVKHGDLDASLLFPTERIDIHMSKHNLLCVDCHRTREHKIPGRSMSVSVDDRDHIYCVDCHSTTPHDDARLNAHVQSVACQTCHIPEIAKEEPTKMTWDWSQAGDQQREAETNDKHRYLAIKGSFEMGQHVVPEYRWYNGFATRYLLGDKIDPGKPVLMAGPLGDIGDPKAKIWPFKVHRGKQVYDKENNYLMVPKVAGDDGFWTTFNWDQSLRLGSKATGLAYSGAYDFAPTLMYWTITHMVSSPDQALTCADCHGDQGRMPWTLLGYEGDPMVRGGRRRLGLLKTPEKKQ